MVVKKVVLKVEAYDDRTKTKALQTVSGFTGVEAISVDKNDKKLTIIGELDPVYLVSKLRKYCPTEIDTVGPAKEPEEKKKEKKDDKAAIPEVYPAYYYPQHMLCYLIMKKG